MHSTRKLLPQLSKAQRVVMARGLRELRALGLVLPAKTRHEIRRAVEAVRTPYSNEVARLRKTVTELEDFLPPQ